MSGLKNQNTIESRVLDFIRKEGLVLPGQKLVVAVSGGADSVCLLYLLADLQKELDISLHIAHLDHRLRGSQSCGDAGYVARLTRRLGLPATVESRDVRPYRQKHRLSLEEAAREVRYAFLAGVAGRVGAERVAVGHTADDNVETILMHLIRGSGLGGLRGLRPLSQQVFSGHSFTIIRPLLGLDREETAACCRKHRLKPRTDISNLSVEPFRNRIRLELLPELRKYNPRIDEALLRTARLAFADLDFIEGEAAKQWAEVARVEGDRVFLDRKKLAGLPPALQRHLLRAAVATRLGGLKDIEAGHIEDLVDALEKPAGKIINLPGGLNFVIEHDRFLLAGDAAVSCPFPLIKAGMELNIPGRTCLPGWNIDAEVVSAVDEQSIEPLDGLTARFDLNRTGKKLKVRSRQPGDRFQPLGLGGTKKLNEFMIDAGIPRAWRQRVPIVASPEGVIWVVGWRIDERVRLTDRTEMVLRLTFKPA